MILLLLTLSNRFYWMLLQSLSIYRFVIDTSLFTAPLNVASDTVVQRVPSICLLLCARCTLKGVRHTHTHSHTSHHHFEWAIKFGAAAVVTRCVVPRPDLLGRGRRRHRFKGMLSKRRGNRSSNNCVHHPPRGRNGNFLFHAFSFRAWHGDMFCTFAFAPLPPPALQSSLHLSLISLSLWVACSSYCFHDMLPAMRAQIRTQLVTLPPFPPCPLTTFVRAGHFRLIHIRFPFIRFHEEFVLHMIFCAPFFAIFYVFLSVLFFVVLVNLLFLKHFVYIFRNSAVFYGHPIW